MLTAPQLVAPSIGHSRSRVDGFSLVELMVALTLGLIVLAAMLDAFTSNSSTGSTNARFTEVSTNGRYAIDNLRRELQLAGFIGITFIDPTDPNPTNVFKAGATATNNYSNCGANFATAIEQPIFGYDDSKGVSDSCIAATDYLHGDVLVLRRADSTLLPTTGGAAANTLYFRSEFLKGTVYLGGAAPANIQTPWQDYVLKADVYWISPYTNSSSESPKVPALYKLTLGPGPAMSKQLIATGIENMQIQYGFVDGAGNTRYYDASSVPTWQDVAAVRIWLMARSTDAEYSGFTNTSTYAMGNQSVTVNDHYQRQVFPLVVQIRR